MWATVAVSSINGYFSIFTAETVINLPKHYRMAKWSNQLIKQCAH